MDELSLPEETETLRFCRQKLIEHKSALKTLPGEDGEVDVWMNVYKSNPGGVRFVSACLPRKVPTRGDEILLVEWVVENLLQIQ